MKDQMTPFVDEFIEKQNGWLFGVKNQLSRMQKRVMVAAHMDEVGFYTTHITENGV